MLADLLPQRLILDRYRIGNRIGAGASGTVYAADDVKQNSQVVIKLFDGASDGFSAWNDEMRLIMRLSHPNIVPCFDVGFDDQLKVWMLVLAYQEGGSLRRWMSDPALRRQIPAKQVLSDIASALLFAHKKGVIHRDVKPDKLPSVGKWQENFRNPIETGREVLRIIQRPQPTETKPAVSAEAFYIPPSTFHAWAVTLFIEAKNTASRPMSSGVCARPCGISAF